MRGIWASGFEKAADSLFSAAGKEGPQQLLIQLLLFAKKAGGLGLKRLDDALSDLKARIRWETKSDLECLDGIVPQVRLSE